MKRISKHISANEATKSVTAMRKGIDNTPSPTELAAMVLVAERVFEPLREHMKRPIKIESFFRCKKLNTAIGGSPNSQHRYGQAIDIDDDYDYPSNRIMFYWMAENLIYDQLIWEFGSLDNPGWIHASYVTGENRNKLSVAYKNKYGKTRYQHFYSFADFKVGLDKIYS